MKREDLSPSGAKGSKGAQGGERRRGRGGGWRDPPLPLSGPLLQEGERSFKKRLGGVPPGGKASGTLSCR